MKLINLLQSTISLNRVVVERNKWIELLEQFSTFASNLIYMIQRVQTIYLAIAIILLSIVTLGQTLFSFVGETSRFSFTSYGISKMNLEDCKIVEQQSFPFFIGTIALILLMFLCIMSYKNLKRQFKLGRTIFYLYLLMLISVLILAYTGDNLVNEKTTTRELGIGFILFVCGLPFVFLANTGIKRDKKLLDSLNRLR